METPGFMVHRPPCDFAECTQRTTEIQGEKIEELNTKVDEHTKVIHEEFKGVHNKLGCLEGKAISNQQLLLELVRKEWGDRYTENLKRNINPNLTDEKIEELKKLEEKLIIEERTWWTRFKIHLWKVGIVALAVLSVILGSYLMKIQIVP